MGGFFFKQKTAYELRISDWSSDVGSSDLWYSTGTTAVLVVRLPASSTASKRSGPAGGCSNSTAKLPSSCSSGSPWRVSSTSGSTWPRTVIGASMLTGSTDAGTSRRGATLSTS